MANFRLLEELRRFNRDDTGSAFSNNGSAALGAAWAVCMCLAVIALFVLYGCDPDPFKGF
jgi:hypothetical protein